MGCRGWADRVDARHGQPPALRVRPDSLGVEQRSGLRGRGHARHEEREWALEDGERTRDLECLEGGKSK